MRYEPDLNLSPTLPRGLPACQCLRTPLCGPGEARSCGASATNRGIRTKWQALAAGEKPADGLAAERVAEWPQQGDGQPARHQSCRTRACSQEPAGRPANGSITWPGDDVLT